MLLVFSGRRLLLVDEVLLDHLLLELPDDGVDAHPLLVRRLQPPQPLRVLGQHAVPQLLQLSLQLRQLVLGDCMSNEMRPIFENTVQTVCGVRICPRGNLPYI